MRTLYGLSQSPWTEKARWALDHCAVTYRYHEHVPVLGEVLLRAKARAVNRSFRNSATRGAFAPMATTAAIFLGSKYDVPRDPEREAEEVLRPAFEELRRALAGRSYLLDRFTFADIAMASSLQTLRARKGSPLGPATREVWENVTLAADLADLLAWRDEIYAKHRTRA